MNLIPGHKTRQELQALQGDFRELQETARSQAENYSALAKIADGLKQKSELQALQIDDITTATSLKEKKFVGNAYRDYFTTIKEIANKYEGTAEWGVLQTGNIIDVRAAFIIGQGVAAIPSSKEYKDSPEMDFIKAFFEYNDLDREMAQEFAKEAEIEGCFLGQLSWNEEDQMVSLQFQSRVDRAYTIAHKPRDYAWYTSATWREADKSLDTVLEEPNFVYIRFGGRVHRVNNPMPKIGKCLTQIESIDKGLRDWREINNLFASPIPIIECADEKSAAAMAAKVASINWKLRKVVTIVGKLSINSPDMAGGVDSLEREIIANAKMVSGTTGCPIGFMGFGDLTTKLGSGSDITSDIVAASTSRERTAWIGGYTQIIQKAIALYNVNSKMTPLDPEAVKVIIPFVTAEAWARIVDVYLPLFMADAIGLETLLSQIPNMDVDAEIEKQEAKKAEEEAAALERFDKSNLNPDNQDDQNNLTSSNAQDNQGKPGGNFNQRGTK
jgi:hypothetical protein